MLLASVAAIISDLGFDDMPDINAAVTAALHSAEAVLSSRLDADFVRGTRTDYFFVKEPPHSAGLFNETKFRLRQSMLVPGSVSLKYAQTMPTLVDGTSVTDLVVDADMGQVTDVATLYEHHFVQVTYTYGFDQTSATQFDLDEVPDWLERAAIVQAKIELITHPVLVQSSVKLDATSLRHELDAILSKRRRYMPMAILPI